MDGVLSYMQVSDDKQKEIIEATMKDDQLKVLKETVSKKQYLCIKVWF